MASGELETLDLSLSGLILTISGFSPGVMKRTTPKNKIMRLVANVKTKEE